MQQHTGASTPATLQKQTNKQSAHTTQPNTQTIKQTHNINKHRHEQRKQTNTHREMA